MVAHLIMAVMLMSQNQVAVPIVAPVAGSSPPAAPSQSVPNCDARPWQHLVGRTIGDLLTVKLPTGTRVFRTLDPIDAATPRGQLSVEIGRNTRVRRVYCS